MLETAASIREQVRSGQFRQPTAGVAGGYVQTNVVILPKSLAFEFLLFCQRNPKPCPVIEVLEPGEYEARISAPGSDIRTDVPRYRVYESGQLVCEEEDLLSLWREDLVTFLLGCSFSFEQALIQAGIQLPYIQCPPASRRNVPMFKTNIPTTPAGPFSGPLVVSQRWIPADQVVRAVQVTSRFPGVHGAPVHIGASELIGIEKPQEPDYGDPWPAESYNPELEGSDLTTSGVQKSAVENPRGQKKVPVYWACGVTPQAVALASKIPFMITHAPGYMFVTDMRDEDLAVI